MPPLAKSLAEEGVVLDPFHLISGGQTHFDRLEDALRGAPYPSRAVDDNLADVRAAVAANHYGVVALEAVVAEHGAEVVAEQMGLLKQRAQRLARAGP